jgi:glycine oxidase
VTSERYPDVVVIGGGIAGCASAYALARDGATVQVIEQHRVGAHASGGSAGILSTRDDPFDTPFDRLGRASLELYPAYAQRLREETGIDIELQLEGVLVLLERDETRMEPKEPHAAVRRLDGSELRELEPNVGERWDGAIFYPGDGQVNTGRLTLALAEAAARRGVQFSEGIAVTGFRERAGRVEGVRTTAGNVPAETVVLAGGPWSGLLAPSIPVFPVKGQIVWARSRPRAVNRPLFALDCYLVPKYELGIAIGATVEHAGFDETPTLAAAADLIRTAIEVCPRLGNAELVRTWASVRPGSADGLPLLGPLPEHPGIIVATGHYVNGILLSLITGELVANWVLGRPQPIDVEAFRLDRF